MFFALCPLDVVKRRGSLHLLLRSLLSSSPLLFVPQLHSLYLLCLIPLSFVVYLGFISPNL